MSKEIFQEIYRLYHLKSADTDEKKKIREFIRRKLKKQFPNKNWNKTSINHDWESLTPYERNFFKYVIIKDNMLKKYVLPNMKKEIQREIDKYIQNEMLYEEKEINEKEEALSPLREYYYDETYSDEGLDEAFRQFFMAVHEINPMVVIPDKEKDLENYELAKQKWIEDNKRYLTSPRDEREPNKTNPMTPQDWIRSEYSRIGMQENDDFNNIYYEKTADELLKNMGSDKDDIYIPASEQEIDHVIIRILLKILEIKAHIHIDIDAIRECLNYTKNYNNEDIDYDNVSDKDLSEEQRYSHRIYVRYEKMLENLDAFIQEGKSYR